MPRSASLVAVVAVAVVAVVIARLSVAYETVHRIHAFARAPRSPPPSRVNAGKMTTTMELRSSPSSALGVDRLILGASPLAGIYAPSSDDVANATVAEALALGFTRFDTAPHYGLGLSERRLGAALRAALGESEANTRVKVYTKVGRVMKPIDEVTEEEKASSVEWGNVPGHDGCIFPEAPRDVLPVLDYASGGFERSHADSLMRLGLDKVEGLRIHDAETPERFEAAMSGGGVAALARLRAQGKIAEVSLGMNDAAYVLRMIRESAPGTFDSVMMAGSWNLIDQDGYEVLLECQERNIAVHNAGVFASGLLVGGAHYKYAPAPEHIKAKTAQWQALANAYDVPLPAVALAFALAPEIITLCAVGVKSPSEVAQNVAWLRAARDVNPQLWIDAKSQGLLRHHIPTPSSPP